jgi:hypothetical protein
MLVIQVFTERNKRVPANLSEIPELEEWRAKKGDYSKYTDLCEFSYWPQNYGTGKWVVALEYEEAGERGMLGTDGKNAVEWLPRKKCGEKIGTE